MKASALLQNAVMHLRVGAQGEGHITWAMRGSAAMTFQRVPDNVKLKRQLNCSVNEDTFEKWHLLCLRNHMTSHALLRQVIEKYILDNGEEQRYGVLKAFKNRPY